jgi:transcription antitermination protein NusB
MGEADGESKPDGGGPREGRRAGRDGRADGAGGRGAVGGRRHQGRVLALQILYEVEVGGHAVEEVMARTLEEQAVPAGMRAHVERLTTGVLGAREEIDPLIAEAAPAFPVAQLPAIDRNVLRLAIFELLHEPGVPPKAAINEAVELAKRFGGDNSGRFVNGVLGTVVGKLGRAAAG